MKGPEIYDIFKLKNMLVLITQNSICIINTLLDDNHEDKIQMGSISKNGVHVTLLKMLSRTQGQPIEIDEFTLEIPKTNRGIQAAICIMNDISELARKFNDDMETEDAESQLSSMLKDMNIKTRNENE